MEKFKVGDAVEWHVAEGNISESFNGQRAIVLEVRSHEDCELIRVQWDNNDSLYNPFADNNINCWWAMDNFKKIEVFDG